MILSIRASLAAAVLDADVAAEAGITHAEARTRPQMSALCRLCSNEAATAERYTRSIESGNKQLARGTYIGAAICGAIIGSVVLVASHPAHAQSVYTLDQVVDQFRMRSAGWVNTLQSFALGTFGILASIELAWAAFRLGFRGADVY